VNERASLPAVEGTEDPEDREDPLRYWGDAGTYPEVETCDFAETEPLELVESLQKGFLDLTTAERFSPTPWRSEACVAALAAERVLLQRLGWAAGLIIGLPTQVLQPRHCHGRHLPGRLIART